MNVMTAFALLAIVAAVDGEPAQTTRYIPGIFVAAPDRPLELIAFAELMSNQRLKMTRGTLEDVPAVQPHGMLRVLAALPNWPPVGVLFASEEIFRDDYAERRTVPFASRPLNVSTVEMRIADLESHERVARLLKSVKASERAPGYAFIVVASSGMARYYPVRLSLDPQ